MQRSLFLLIGLWMVQVFAVAEESIPQRWLLEPDGQTKENYYLSADEKARRLSESWKTYVVNGGRAQIRFPWEPDNYELPTLPMPGGRACTHALSLAERDEGLVFSVSSIRCEGMKTEEDLRKRSNGVLNGLLKHGRKLVDKTEVEVRNGYGVQALVEYLSGNVSYVLLISIKDSTYVVSVTGANRDSIKELSKVFIASFRVDDQGWKVNVRG